jgi:hypothetical protein
MMANIPIIKPLTINPELFPGLNMMKHPHLF